VPQEARARGRLRLWIRVGGLSAEGPRQQSFVSVTEIR
jgi:hypothetical protein